MNLQKINVEVGNSETNVKSIKLDSDIYQCDPICNKQMCNYDFPDTFDISIVKRGLNSELVVKRTDSTGGWGQNLSVSCLSHQPPQNIQHQLQLLSQQFTPKLQAQVQIAEKTASIIPVVVNPFANKKINIKFDTITGLNAGGGAGEGSSATIHSLCYTNGKTIPSCVWNYDGKNIVNDSNNKLKLKNVNNNAIFSSSCDDKNCTWNITKINNSDKFRIFNNNGYGLKAPDVFRNNDDKIEASKECDEKSTNPKCHWKIDII